jgi:uncharacterized protein (DUF2249 family)
MPPNQAFGEDMKVIDARNMPPPAPFERVLEALGELQLGDKLKLIVPHEPVPLFRFLLRNNYAYRVEKVAQGNCEVVMWELPAEVAPVDSPGEVIQDAAKSPPDQ